MSASQRERLAWPAWPTWLPLSLALAGCVGAIELEAGETTEDPPAPLRPPATPPAGSAGALPGSAPGPGPLPGGVPGQPPAAGEVAMGGLSVTPRRIRRLTPLEYGRTVERVLRRRVTAELVFPGDPTQLGYQHFGTELGVPSLLVEGLWGAARQWVAEASLPALITCDPRADEAGCARKVVRDAARLAFRRSPTDEEVADLVEAFQLGRTGGTFESGVRLALEAILQSPFTLFRTELGGAPDAQGLVTLTADEIASQLSYLFAGGPPDEELMAAAASGKLATPEGRAQQARRLLDGPDGRTSMRELARGWLMLDALTTEAKNPKIFPAWNAELEASMRDEILDLAARVFASPTGRVADLFTARRARVSESLARLYAVTAVRPFPAEVELPPERAGVLGRGALLAALAHSAYGSPVKRGLFIRGRLLCEETPAPPPELEVSIPATPPRTTREMFATHAENPSCAGCHGLIDPLGFPLEVFDGIGRLRRTENGVPVDATGEVRTASVSRRVDGPADLGAALLEAPETHACLVRHWLRYASARPETALEAQWARQAGERLKRGELGLRDLLLSTVTAPTFVVRRAP